MITHVYLEDLPSLHAGLGSRTTSITADAISAPRATVKSVQPIIEALIRVYELTCRITVASSTNRDDSPRPTRSDIIPHPLPPHHSFYPPPASVLLPWSCSSIWKTSCQCTQTLDPQHSTPPNILIYFYHQILAKA